MNAYAVSLSKYVNTGLLASFTLLSYVGLFLGGGRVRGKLRSGVEIFQRLLLAAFLINANLTIAWFVRGEQRRSIFLLCAMEILFMLAFMALFRIVHENAGMLLFNNICMLLSVGFVAITRLAFYGEADAISYRANEPVKQFVIASAGLLFMLVMPFFRRFFDHLRHLGVIFGVLGLVLLGGVLLISDPTNGARITFTLSGATFQPSEFVKILYILMLAALLSGDLGKGRVFLATVLAAIHIGILVLSRDLGSALIFFIVYLMVMFFATGEWKVVFGGLSLGAVGSVVCYILFSHVRVRVDIWRDPFADIENMGYQVTQSLFAISYGGPWGAGLTQGDPGRIPLVESDFIFSAIAEEMGLVFGVCLLLLCINCFLRILALSAGYSNRFFQLFTYGSAVCYIFQSFLTVGGETKFIPLTGVTLPLVSYGGSSVLATLILFGIIEMIYILDAERSAGYDGSEREASDDGGGSDYSDADGYGPKMVFNDAFGAGGFGGPDDSGPGGYAGSDYYGPDGLPENFPVNGVSEEEIYGGDLRKYVRERPGRRGF